MIKDYVEYGTQSITQVLVRLSSSYIDMIINSLIIYSSSDLREFHSDLDSDSIYSNFL